MGIDKRQAVPPDQAEGEKLVRAFVDQFSKLPMSQLAPAEALRAVTKLRVDLERPNNSFVKKLLLADVAAAKKPWSHNGIPKVIV